MLSYKLASREALLKLLQKICSNALKLCVQIRLLELHGTITYVIMLITIQVNYWDEPTLAVPMAKCLLLNNVHHT